MRVLITWGSKLGGTEGIARILGDSLASQGFEIEMRPAAEVGDPGSFDAVIVGGALYGNRWHAGARRFVRRHVNALRGVPVWFFSSGPLDDSAERQELPLTRQVAVLMERVGGLGHRTFGGRLAPDAKGFPASAMAKTSSGDWRNPEHIRAWATELGRSLPFARPGVPIAQPARALPRLLAHGVAGWALSAATMFILLQVAGTTAAVVLHAILAPILIAVVAYHYFRPRGAREPLPTALAFTGIVAVLDAVVVAGLIQRSPALLGSIGGLWLPLLLIFLVTWAIGGLVSTLPWPKRDTVVAAHRQA
jgi:menaquinone-dependent protoporphyrinogen oxidase